MRWFDRGQLKGYRIPGSEDRRIPLENLISFMREKNMQLGGLEDEVTAKVLVVSQDPVLIESLKREMAPERSFKVAVADGCFEAGIQAESMRPDCVIVDFSFDQLEALKIFQKMVSNPEFALVARIALVPDDGQPISHEICLASTEAYKKFDAAFIASRVRTIVGSRKSLA